MELIIRGRHFKDPELRTNGGEGDIYDIDQRNVAKRYYIADDARRQKVLALCDFHDSFLALHKARLIAFPQHPAYEGQIAFENLVGFSMEKYDFPTLSSLGFNSRTKQFRKSKIGNFSFDDKGAIRVVYELFGVLEELHRTRVVLGDVNPGNIMWDARGNQVAIVDVDAAQVGGYACWSWHPDYCDPRVEDRGTDSSRMFTYDFGSDVFALASVCYEFLVGALPYALHVKPNLLAADKKRKSISELKCMAQGVGHLKVAGVEYLPCAINRDVRLRIDEIRAKDGFLFDFFISVFVNGERENMLYSLPLKDARHPGHCLFNPSSPKATIARGETMGPQFPTLGGEKVISDTVSRRSSTHRPKARLQRSRADPPALTEFLTRLKLVDRIL